MKASLFVTTARRSLRRFRNSRSCALGVVICGVIIALWPATGHAQQSIPGTEFFVGGSKLWADEALTNIVCSPTLVCTVQTDPAIRTLYHDHGWGGSVTGNLNRIVGLEVEFGTNPGLLTLLAGPHLAYHASGRVNPFGHVLFGGAHQRQIAPQAHSTAYNAFTTAFGGGLDVRAARVLSIRVIQADYLRESFKDDLQNNLRLSFGFVLRFGSLTEPNKK